MPTPVPGWRRCRTVPSRPAPAWRRSSRRWAGPYPMVGPDPADVIDLLAAGAEPGLVGMPSGRFFGFVIGGTHPAALAADWLVSAWDQNWGLRLVTPAHTAVEDTTGAWLLDLLGLAAGRHAVLAQTGWNVARDGLSGAPRVRVLVGAERHETVDLALRYLGLGVPEPVAADD